MAVLGIDVSKNDLHAALIGNDGRAAKHSFPNTARGFEQLLRWLKNRGVEDVHACMEASGGWGEDAGIALVEHGYLVSIVNPARIKAFGKSEGVRTKTDAVDASLIARFCKAQNPELWTPPSPSARALQALVRRRESLIQMRTQETNRLKAARVSSTVKESIEEHQAFLDDRIDYIEGEIRKLIDSDPDLRGKSELLATIPGIGAITANAILGELPNLHEFRNVKAVAAYAGLSPRHNQSGVFQGRSRLCKAGNANLRKTLYFPAITAMRCNPTIQRFVDRLSARGKRKMVVIAAVMRKLLTIAYGVVKSGRPYYGSVGA
jgi:transposase